MDTGVEYVRQICKQKGIAISKLEKDLGFGNGYFNPRKLKRIPMEKAIAIAEYLGCEVEPLLGEKKLVPIYIKRPKTDAFIRGAFETDEDYHHFQETQAMAQEIFEEPALRTLFDAARGCKPEDLKMASDLLIRLKGTNPDG